MSGEIPLIPRPFKRLSMAEKREYAKKKAEEAQKAFLDDPKEVKKAASLYEQRIAEERRRVGLCPRSR